MITQQEVLNLFDYVDGALYWKNTTCPRLKNGERAGFVNETGYHKIKIKSKHYGEHQIVFLMFNGYLPKVLDHVNFIRNDNRIENLREVTTQENCINRSMYKNNKSGYKGVCYDKSKNKWVVTIQLNKKKKHIGYFEDVELADLVSQEAISKYHGKFANYGRTL